MDPHEKKESGPDLPHRMDGDGDDDDQIQSNKDEKNSKPSQRKPVNLERKLGHSGKVVKICDRLNFLKVDRNISQNDVLVHSDKLSKFCLSLKVGDELCFELNQRNKSKPSVAKAKPVIFKERTEKELSDYFDEASAHLASKNCLQAIIDILSLLPMWHAFVAKAKKSGQIAFKLGSFILNIMKKSKAQHALMAKVLELVFHDLKFQQMLYDFISEDDFADPIISVGIQKQKVSQMIKQLISQLERPIKELMIPCGRQIVQYLLYDDNPTQIDRKTILEIFDSIISNKDYSNSLITRHASSILPNEDTIRQYKTDRDSGLIPVKVGQTYDDSDDYLETYYRLTWADTFSAMSKGIKDQIDDELDHRDMNVFVNVQLVGVLKDITSEVSYALKFTPVKKVKGQTIPEKVNWKASKKLMYGNLLAISLDNKFRQIVWAYVSERDDEKLKKSIIVVNLCHQESMDHGKLVHNMARNSGRMIMAECPVYYRATGPILEHLRDMDMTEHSLMHEVLKCESTGPPNLLNNSESYHLLKKSHMEKLDPSQREAYQYALQHKVAIIQGPPGTGKTYLGTKLCELLMKHCQMNDFSDDESPEYLPTNDEFSVYESRSPILVLTYKNHALDEFLKHTLKFCGKEDVIRIGGRSKEPELDECNLNIVTRNNRDINAKNVQEIMNRKDRLNHESKEYFKCCSEVVSSASLTVIDVLGKFNEDQLKSLLLDENWNKFKLKNLNKKASQKAVGDLISVCYYLHENLINFVWNIYSTEYINYFQLRQDEWDLKDLLEHAVTKWLPTKDELNKCRMIYDNYSGLFDSPDIRSETKEDFDADELDEDTIQEIQASRMIGGDKKGEKGKIQSKEICFFKDVGHMKYQLSQFPNGIKEDTQLIKSAKLWKLKEEERIKFLFTLLIQSTQEAKIQELSHWYKDIDQLQLEKQELEVVRQFRTAKSAKIVGATITGASIHTKLIQQLAPKIVIVEEAAEILESGLISAIPSSVNHLIMIGDHKQLRPSVNDYILTKYFNFDLSLFERMIRSKYPFKTLTTQSRMRPEMSALLRDIYPKLEDNLKVVEKRKPANFMEKSMFFWTHSHKEDLNPMIRSKLNEKEAEMAVVLAQFMVKFGGVSKENITILVAYLSQKKIVRKFLMKSDLLDVKCTSIDEYQGDENEFVIVSMVRSEKLGYLNIQNRRCVSQSRAKNGLYFIGNLKPFMEKDNVWTPILKKLEDHGQLGSEIVINCPKHPEASKVKVKNADAFKALLDQQEKICQIKCDVKMPCGIPEHNCSLACSSRNHNHVTCQIRVKKDLPCGHNIEAKCHEDENKLTKICSIKLDYQVPKCKHWLRVKCHVNRAKLICNINCEYNYPCGHKCSKECGNRHQHNFCTTKESTVFPICQHNLPEKECGKPFSDYTCEAEVKVTLSKCGHECTKKCHVEKSQIVCYHECKQTKPCGHECKEKCGSNHSHEVCKEEIDAQFEKCKHPTKKKCSQAINWICQKKVPVTLSCKHENIKVCGVPDNEVKCTEKCVRVRKCGHPCKAKCGENCELLDCHDCLQIFRSKAEKKAKQLQKTIQENLKKKEKNVFLTLLDQNSSEFLDIADKVYESNLAMHNWQKTVTKIEKITNYRLQEAYECAKSQCFGTREAEKFHGTSLEGVKGIQKEGFRLPSENSDPGMYGRGIYFATNSSKSAQEIYTKKSNTLLLCKVLLGKELRQDRADITLNYQKLRNMRYDSVFAPRNTKGTGGVMNDEFIVFDPKQVLPQYIIFFGMSHDSNISKTLKSIKPPPSQGFTKKNVQPSRKVDDSDPFDIEFRMVESHFLRNIRNAQGKKISSIDFVYNDTLQKKFDDKQAEFKRKKIPSDTIFAYHGTKPENIDSILKTNLNRKVGQAYGPGYYFSEFPDFSLGYGQLIVFKVLPGKEYIGSDCNAHTGPNARFQSRKVQATGEYGQILVIDNTEQFVPYCVLHLL